MGTIRDLLKKTWDIKGTFHARMSMIKGRNSKDLSEAEQIKKRWQEYIEELYKKGLNNLDNHSMWTLNFQMFKLVLEKAEEPEIKLPTLLDRKSKRVPEKHLFLLYWLCQSLWLCGSQRTVENSERDGNTRPPASWETCMQVRKQQLELDMEQQTGSK